MFTEGQKERMRALFDPGGARYSLLSSVGLDRPASLKVPVFRRKALPGYMPARLYPNPAKMRSGLTSLTMPDGSVRHLIYDTHGESVQQVLITGKVQVISETGLRPGIYFDRTKRRW